jgi:hypothetical protein
LHALALIGPDLNLLSMTGDVLPSDVEFARGLLNSSLSDPEILEHLLTRGIDRDKAAQLLDDLRHGRKPQVQVHFALGSTGRTQHRRPKPSRRNNLAQSGGSMRRRAVGLWWFILIAVIFCCVIGYAFFRTGANASKNSNDVNQHTTPAAPGK